MATASHRTLAAGIAFNGIGDLSGGLRYFGGIPLVEDARVRGEDTTQVNARLVYGVGKHLNLTLDVFNVLDTDDPDIQYYYTSRLPGEPVDGYDDIHFHPAEPRAFRLSLSWRP